MYDYLVVGSGLFGAVCTRELLDRGKSVLVLERRSHTGGNVHCTEKEGIQIHSYGAHIFHTSDLAVWDYVNRFAEFCPYHHSPVASYQGRQYSLPFNMKTFVQLWGTVTPAQAAARIAAQTGALPAKPQNLEEKAIALVGRELYDKLIKGYTEKQWGRECRELPAFIIERIPVRYTFDDNYFTDTYQGIPVDGYNRLIDALLAGSEVITNVDFHPGNSGYAQQARRIIYTGPLDAYFDYALGTLEYRSLHFDTIRFEEQDHQGTAVINYTDRDVAYTRSIEHKHFMPGRQPITYVTYEYPLEWKVGREAYYPVQDGRNSRLHQQYKAMAAKEKNVIFGGRLADYQYYDMDDVIRQALSCVASRCVTGLKEREESY